MSDGIPLFECPKCGPPDKAELVIDGTCSKLTHSPPNCTYMYNTNCISQLANQKIRLPGSHPLLLLMMQQKFVAYAMQTWLVYKMLNFVNLCYGLPGPILFSVALVQPSVLISSV